MTEKEYEEHETEEDVADSRLVKVTEEQAKEIARKYYRYDRIASERVPSIGDVDEAALERYRDQGYLIVDSVLSGAEVKDALAEISDIVHQKLKGPKVQLVRSEADIKTPEEREFAARKIYNYMNYAPALRSIGENEGILEVVRKILKDDAVLVGQQGLLKPPFGGGEKPWHQDMAYGGLFYKKQIVSVWIALDDAGLDNGCMHLIPRSHLRGGVPHFLVRDWQICDTHVDVENDAAAIMQSGSVLFFSGLLYHGTPANFSARKRRAIQLRFAPASSEMMSKDEYKLMFTNSLVDVEC